MSLPPPWLQAVERHLGRRLLPPLFLVSLLCQLDRSNLAFAALQMDGDLGFSKTIHGLGSGERLARRQWWCRHLLCALGGRQHMHSPLTLILTTFDHSSYLQACSLPATWPRSQPRWLAWPSAPAAGSPPSWWPGAA